MLRPGSDFLRESEVDVVERKPHELLPACPEMVV